MVLLQKPIPSHCTAEAPQVRVLGRSPLVPGSAATGTAASQPGPRAWRGDCGDLTMPPHRSRERSCWEPALLTLTRHCNPRPARGTWLISAVLVPWKQILVYPTDPESAGALAALWTVCALLISELPVLAEHFLALERL